MSREYSYGSASEREAADPLSFTLICTAVRTDGRGWWVLLGFPYSGVAAAENMYVCNRCRGASVTAAAAAAAVRDAIKQLLTPRTYRFFFSGNGLTRLLSLTLPC